MAKSDSLTRELRSRLPEYVNMVTKPDHPGSKKIICPLCGSGTKENKTGGLSIDPSSNNEQWKCFSCGEGGDIFDLIGKLENIPDFPGRKKRLAEIFNLRMETAAPQGYKAAGEAKERSGIENMEPIARTEEPERKPEPNQYKDYIEKCHARVNQTTYWATRGFTPATIEKFNLGYDPNYKDIGASVIIPYGNDYFIARSIEGKNFRKPNSKEAGAEPLYNLEALYNETKPCFVVESQIDAISIEQAGGRAVAIGGAGRAKLIQVLKKRSARHPLILAFDNDEPGRRITEETANDLKKLGHAFIRAKFAICGDFIKEPYKDTNDLLKAADEALKLDIRQNEKKALRHSKLQPINIAQYLSSHDYETDLEIFQTGKMRKTGFKNLDEDLTLYAGLMVIGGSASLGKTTFCINLADNLLRHGEDVIYFALEQDAIELTQKFICRRIYEENPITHITNKELRGGASSPEIDKAIKSFAAKEAKRLTIVRSNFQTSADDIREYVEKYIDETSRTPIVFVDYLQLIAPPANFKGDTRSALEYTVKELKSLQRDNDLLLVVISNFNRAAYTTAVSYEAFKETGLIEYTADYMLGLQLSVLGDKEFYKNGKSQTLANEKTEQIEAANARNPKEVTLVCMKQRAGKQSFKHYFFYDMPHDVFAPNEARERDQGGELPKGWEPVNNQVSFEGVPVI